MNKNRIRRAADFLLGNWASRIYLLSLGVAMLLAVVASPLGHVGDGVSFVSIEYIVVLTAPGSLAFMSPMLLAVNVLTESTVGPVMAVLVPFSMLAGALINTMVISAVVRNVKQRRAARPAVS